MFKELGLLLTLKRLWDERAKPWIDRLGLQPLLDGLLAALKKLGAKALENPVEHPGRGGQDGPPSKPNKSEDITNQPTNV